MTWFYYLCIIIWTFETLFGIFMVFHGGVHVDPTMHDAELCSILVNALCALSYICCSVCFKASLDSLKEEKEYERKLKLHTGR